MKKNMVLLSMGVLATTTWLGCSHTSTKNESVSRAQSNSAERKLAGLMDAGIVGPNGEVILFYKSANKIVIQQCEDYTVLNRREDCTTKSGTSVAQVPVTEFKNRLKAALIVPAEYPAAMKEKIDLYNKGKQDDIADLERQRAEVQRAIQQIQDFITAYGQENADQGKMDNLKQRLGVIEGKLGDNSKLAGAIREINQLIDKLVDQIIGQPALQKFVFSKDKQSFEFNILRSYVKTPGLSAQFARIRAGTFQMGSPSSEVGRHDDEVLHSVTLTKDFEIQQTEVTQAHWFLVMGYNPSYFKSKGYCSDDYLEINGAALCPNNPVEQVSWSDTQDFIKKLNDGNDGYAYRLPTEAEWEYAARGGTQAAYSFGDDARAL
ncbi:MAG: formylglycine-generating enzyme family protein, partial [Pseudobdellovibrionaceae bacterium]